MMNDPETIARRFGNGEWPDLKPRGTFKDWFLTVAVPIIQAATLVMILFLIWDWML